MTLGYVRVGSPPVSDLVTQQPARANGDAANVVLRPGAAADWGSCWAMDVSYDTEYVWQLQSSMQADVPMSGFVQVRLPRTIVLRDPLWGGTASPPQPAQGSLTVAESQGAIDGFALVVPDVVVGRHHQSRLRFLLLPIHKQFEQTFLLHQVHRMSFHLQSILLRALVHLFLFLQLLHE